jgi:uncharacterized membrane protein
MNRVLSVLAAAGLGVLTLAAASSAHAWTAIGNATPNTVFVVYAHDRNGDCNVACGGGGKAALFNQGWWHIAPGGVVTVNGHHFHEEGHAIFAEDDFGRFWAGSSFTFNGLCVPFTAFNMCGNQCPAGSRVLNYRPIGPFPYTECCHDAPFACLFVGNDNFQTNLTL